MGPSTSSTKATENKIDEMTKLIKSLSLKITKLEMENKPENRPVQKGDNRNPNQFRCLFVPRFFPMEMSNTDDQRLQPHFQNNLVDETEEIEEVEMEDIDQEINNLECG